MKFTESQTKALTLGKNILVEAGAGSGKTTIFVQRLIRLLQTYPDLELHNILAITFTNKAAGEILERVHKIATNHTSKLPPNIKQKLLTQLNNHNITTIHGFCSKLLRKYALTIQIDPLFAVLDSSQTSYLQKTAIKTTINHLSSEESPDLKNYLLQFPLKRLEQDLQTLLNNNALTPASTHSILDSLLKLSEETKKRYNTLKKTESALDFNDLIIQTKELLLDQKILTAIQSEINHIFVDEFQDTDPKQWELIQLLCDTYQPLDTKKLFLVGDLKQSIYGFRGANTTQFTDVMATFKQMPHNCQIVTMADNFRTQKPLIDSLNNLFSPLFSSNKTTIPYTPLKSPLINEKHSLTTLLSSEQKTDLEEIKIIAKWIKTHLSENANLTFKDISILCRKKKNFDRLSSELEKENIPTKTDSILNFYQKEDVIDAALLTTALTSPYNDLAWTRVLTSPILDLSHNLLYEIQTHSGELSLIQKLQNTAIQTHKVKEAQKNIRNWMDRIKTTPISQVIETALKETNTLSTNTKLFIEELEKLENSSFSRKALLDQLETNIQNNTPIKAPHSQKDAVNLLTIHASKGLEFPTVIISFCHQAFNFSTQSATLIKDDLIHINVPSNNEKEDPIRKELLKKIEEDIISEEKRLFYVACTRAKNHLCFTGNMSMNPACEESPKSFSDFIQAHLPQTKEN